MKRKLEDDHQKTTLWDLPQEVSILIFQLVDIRSVGKLLMLSKSAKKYVSENKIWQRLWFDSTFSQRSVLQVMSISSNLIELHVRTKVEAKFIALKLIKLEPKNLEILDLYGCMNSNEDTPFFEVLLIFVPEFASFRSSS